MRLALAILWLAMPILAIAQEPAYLHYEVSDGLPSSLVYCIEQDSMGVMWLGTDKGLVRFDGSRFRTFSIKNGLPDNEVLNMYSDSFGRLWLSCFRNKPCYEKHGEIFTEAHDPMLKGLDMNTGTFVFEEDKNGTLWMTGGVTGLGRVSGNDASYFGKQQLFGSKSYNTNLNSIWSLGNKVFAFSNSKIFSISDRGKATLIYNFPLERGFLDVVSIGVSGNRLLCSMMEGLYLMEYEGGELRIIEQQPDGVYGRVFTDSEGKFWIGSQSEGAICYDHRRDGLSKPIRYLANEKVTCVFEDKTGNFWFSTFNAGVFVLPKNAAITYDNTNGRLFVSNNLTSVTKLTNGEIMVGDDAGTLYQFNRKTWCNKLKLNSSKGINRVLQIVPLENEQWIAVTDKGVHTSSGGLFSCFADHGAPKSLAYKNEEVWLGTSHFLMQKTPSSDTCTVVKEQRYMSLCWDSENNLWAGGLNGLFSQKDKFGSPQKRDFKPIESRILDIKMGHDGKLWAATPDYGLLKVGVKKGTVVDVEIINDSLKTPIENIQSMFIAPTGELWLASNTGVYALDSGYGIRHFDTKNGLVANNVNAVLVEEDTLWAVTAAGLSKLQLREQGESGDFNTRFAAVHYTLGDKKIAIDLMSRPPGILDEVVLPSGSSQLVVEVAGLHYRSWGNVRFEYHATEKLLPLRFLTFGNIFSSIFDDPVTSTMGSASRNFGFNLPTGRYLSTVTAILPGGTRSTRPDHLTITILPHWWQTIWFSLALAAAAGLGLWRLLRARESYLKIQNTNSELQLQAIRAQMNPHFVGNSINAIQQFFYPPDPVRASEYIAIFSDLLRRTMYFSETDFITFDQELSYVKDYLEMIKLRFGERFSYEIKGVEALSASTPFPAMLLQPILENATIHGLAPKGHSHLEIVFAENAGRVTCSVTDNGVGIESAKARVAQSQRGGRISKGILLLEKKVETLNQLHPTDLNLAFHDLSHDSDSSHGTRVMLSYLPIKKAVADRP